MFTSGGTEAVNAAIAGAVLGPAERRTGIVTTAVEHSSVLDACRRASEDTTVVGVDEFGRFTTDDVLDAVTDTHRARSRSRLANHEVGTIQDVRDICVGSTRRRRAQPPRRVRRRSGTRR